MFHLKEHFFSHRLQGLNFDIFLSELVFKELRLLTCFRILERKVDFCNFHFWVNMSKSRKVKKKGMAHFFILSIYVWNLSFKSWDNRQVYFWQCEKDYENKFLSETLKIEGNFWSKMLKLEKHILLIFLHFVLLISL